MTAKKTEGRTATVEDIALSKDRLRGTGAWNGNGLLPFLALTHRKDSSRIWMEPLRDLCQQIVNDEEDGIETALTAEQAATMDDLATYSATFMGKLAAAAARGE